MKNLAAFCYDRRRLVLLSWVFLIVGLFALQSAVGGEYKTDFKLPGSESQAALDLLKDRGVEDRTGFPGQIVFKADQGVKDPTVRSAMERFFDDVENSVDGVAVVSPYEPQNAYQISSDGKIAYAEVNFSDRSNEQYVKDAKVIKNEWRRLEVPAGVQVELGGDLFVDQVAFSSEFVGIMAAIIILIIAFGSLAAMGLPIITALFGIGCGAAIIGLMTRLLAVPEFTTQIGAMIGIGVGIDYALLIVTRYRAGLHDGLEPRDAVGLSVDTSGRAVLFAGITVVIALLGMFFLNLDFLRSLAIGSSASVLMTMLGALTLLPAMLGFVGYNIDRPALAFSKWGRGVVGYRPAPAHVVNVAQGLVKLVLGIVLFLPKTLIALPRIAKRFYSAAPPPAAHPTFDHLHGDITRSFWYKWSRVIQAHPWPALVLSATLLIILAIPVFSLRLGFADAGNRKTTDTTRRAYDILSEGFGVGFNTPIVVVVDTPDSSAVAAVNQLKTQLEQTAGVSSVSDPIPLADGKVQLINVFPNTSPQDEATTDLVHRIRHGTVANVMSGRSNVALTSGGPGFVVDFSDYMGQKLPIFFGAVLILSFILLTIVFHSVVVPLKAVLMNMLSIGASFGAIVAVFQWGFGASIIGIGQEGPIEAWAPIMLFAILFGLSMDYEVFLLTRVREEYDRSGDNRKAVADGLAATGRVISAAAAIMVCVFGSFVLSDDRGLKLIGFGLASAVFIDATIVRLVLVPSAMELLGNANWWAPSWLVRYLPTIKVDPAQPLHQPTGGGGS